MKSTKNSKILNTDSTYNYLFKIQLVGDHLSGKSCLLLRFAENTFSESFTSRAGLDFKLRHIKSGQNIVKLQIWKALESKLSTDQFKYDGQLDDRGIRGSHAFLILCDLSNPKSFEKVKNFYFPGIASWDDTLPIILVGTKSDLLSKENLVKESKKLKDFAKEHLLGFATVSAKDATNVEILFEKMASELVAANKNNQNKTIFKEISLDYEFSQTFVPLVSVGSDNEKELFKFTKQLEMDFFSNESKFFSDEKKILSRDDRALYFASLNNPVAEYFKLRFYLNKYDQLNYKYKQLIDKFNRLNSEYLQFDDGDKKEDDLKKEKYLEEKTKTTEYELSEFTAFTSILEKKAKILEEKEKILNEVKTEASNCFAEKENLLTECISLFTKLNCEKNYTNNPDIQTLYIYTQGLINKNPQYLFHLKTEQEQLALKSLENSINAIKAALPFFEEAYKLGYSFAATQLGIIYFELATYEKDPKYYLIAEDYLLVNNGKDSHSSKIYEQCKRMIYDQLQSGNLHQVGGIVLDEIKILIKNTKPYRDLLSHHEKKKNDIKFSQRANFLKLVDDCKNMDDLAMLLSASYRSYCRSKGNELTKRQIEMLETASQLNDALSKETNPDQIFSSSSTAKYLIKIDQEFKNLMKQHINKKTFDQLFNLPVAEFVQKNKF